MGFFDPFATGKNSGGGGGGDGRGIVSIRFKSSDKGDFANISGAIDTYEIKFTDGSSSQFTVYNGEDGTSPTFKMEDSILKVSYDNGETWTDLQSFSDIIDPSGDYTELKKEIKDIKETTKKVEYEFFSLFDDTRVSNNGKEFRIMFDENTKWFKQSGGATNIKSYNPNNYYFSMRAYAPSNEVTGFKEDIGLTIKDETLYHFDDDFAGVDEYGRKYSIIWFPAAEYDEETEKWTYFGKDSSKNGYLGWNYTVEWYNDKGQVVASDSIRIDLTNELCHNNIEPYFMKDYLKKEDLKTIPIDNIQDLKWTSTFDK